MTATHKEGSLFRKFIIATIATTYLLILAGGIVRSTGSGMGCPDWPKCFGQLIPPTDEAQLPSNYQEVYKEKRLKKNQKLAGYFDRLGFTTLAYEIKNDPAIQKEEPFNLSKTWTEYINRLWGALTGVFILGTFIASFRYLRENKQLFLMSGLAFFLVGFQGWIGSLVVSTNLLPWMVTFHMILALVLVFLLIHLYYRSAENVKTVAIPKGKFIKRILVLCLVLLLVQIAMGTQVREAIDGIATAFDHAFRDQWISQLGTTFYLHRSFSLLILLLHVYLFYLLFKHGKGRGKVLNLSKILLAFILIEIFTGAVMAYFAIPAFIQPVHLFVGSLAAGMQYLILLNLGNKKMLIPAQ